MSYFAHTSVRPALAEIDDERQRQDAKWGEQNHPDGTIDNEMRQYRAYVARDVCQEAAREGRVTWRHILDEEVAEAFCETDPAKLRAELVQIGAVAVAWIEAIDRRAWSESLPVAEAKEEPTDA